MPIPRRYTTDAIVLSRFDLGEADRVLTLITPTGGKLKAIAKGVRRPTSRLGGSLEPFAELTIGLARWIATHYLAPASLVIRAMLPPRRAPASTNCSKSSG